MMSTDKCPICGGRVEIVDGHRVEYHGPICPECPLNSGLSDRRRSSSCRPGAWGGAGCVAHEGHEIGTDGRCIEGRALLLPGTDPKP